MLVVTTETIPGRSIYTTIGQVMGIAARPTNPFTEGLKTLDGRSHPMAPSLLRGRSEAIAHMVAEATRLGADAVIGMKFDNRMITATATWSEICAYGTAVRLADPIRRRVSAPPSANAGWARLPLPK